MADQDETPAKDTSDFTAAETKFLLAALKHAEGGTFKVCRPRNHHSTLPQHTNTRTKVQLRRRRYRARYERRRLGQGALEYHQ